MTTLYTIEEIRELYHKTSADSYMEQENKEWLSDEKKEEFENAINTLRKIRLEIKYKELDCKMNSRVRLLLRLNCLYDLMCDDIREDLKHE